MATRSLIVDGRRLELDDDVALETVRLVMESALQQGRGDILLKGGELHHLDLTPDSRYIVEVGA